VSVPDKGTRWEIMLAKTKQKQNSYSLGSAMCCFGECSKGQEVRRRINNCSKKKKLGGGGQKKEDEVKNK